MQKSLKCLILTMLDDVLVQIALNEILFVAIFAREFLLLARIELFSGRRIFLSSSCLDMRGHVTDERHSSWKGFVAHFAR